MKSTLAGQEWHKSWLMSENRIRAEINDDPPDCLQLCNHWSFSRCDPDFGFDYRGRLPGQVIFSPYDFESLCMKIIEKLRQSYGQQLSRAAEMEEVNAPS